VPAAAVIPAPRVYIKVVAVKKLVVEPIVLDALVPLIFDLGITCPGVLLQKYG
jgi:hypothetical protein